MISNCCGFWSVTGYFDGLEYFIKSLAVQLGFVFHLLPCKDVYFSLDKDPFHGSYL